MGWSAAIVKETASQQASAVPSDQRFRYAVDGIETAISHSAFRHARGTLHSGAWWPSD
jgi:hypothetical protein